jgi:hypothetical protein
MSVESDLLAMTTGWDSQSVGLGDFNGFGLLDQRDEIESDPSGDPVMKRVTVLTLRRSDFLDTAGLCTVARGDVATVDGIAYTVGDVRMGDGDDGRELHLVLRKVAR